MSQKGISNSPKTAPPQPLPSIYLSLSSQQLHRTYWLTSPPSKMKALQFFCAHCCIPSTQNRDITGAQSRLGITKKFIFSSLQHGANLIRTTDFTNTDETYNKKISENEHTQHIRTNKLSFGPLNSGLTRPGM